MRVHGIFIAFIGLIGNYAIAQNTNPWPATGNVGIGTATPNSNALLELKKDVSGGSGPVLRLTGGGSVGAQCTIDLATYDPGTSLPGGRIVATDDGYWGCSIDFQSKLTGAISNSMATRLRIANNGNIGIGTTTPTAPLTVSTSADVMSVFQNPGTSNVRISVINNTGQLNLGIGSNTPHPYAWSSTNSYFIGSDVNPTFFVAGMSNGNVGIGTSTPKAKLAVNGDILAKKVTVSVNNLPDYVFDNNYSLRPLSEIEKYIQQNHHLPEVPSAAQVEKDGLNLGDNQATLLKKIEELTLYVIEMEKNQKQQQQEIQQLKKLLSEKSK